VTESVSICGLDEPDGSMCKDPADGPGQPCKRHKLAPPASASRDIARTELIGAVEMILVSQQEAGRMSFNGATRGTIARAIVDELSMHVMLKILSGVAVPPT
jgi:hypothetical protein